MFDFPKVPVGPMGPNRTDLLYTFTHSIESKNEIKFFSIFRPHLNFRTHFHQLPIDPRTTSAHQNDRTDLPNTFTYPIESKNVINILGSGPVPDPNRGLKHVFPPTHQLY